MSDFRVSEIFDFLDEIIYFSFAIIALGIVYVEFVEPTMTNLDSYSLGFSLFVFVCMLKQRYMIHILAILFLSIDEFAQAS